MRYAIRGLLALGLLSACSSNGAGDDRPPTSAAGIATAQVEVSDEPVVLGSPFAVGGITYTPQDVPTYDEVGYASQYRTDPTTANGEMFKPMAATASHRTLPLPSYVEVTALDTGRTILVRINDRGPMANDRLLGLSEGAARQLGLAQDTVTGVRVRRINPPEQEKAVLRQGIAAAERIETSEPLLKVLRDKLAKQPKPVAVAQTAVPISKVAAKPETSLATDTKDRFIREGNASGADAKPSPERAIEGGYVVQVAALSSRSSAYALARKLGAAVANTADGRLFRVRYGPYASKAEAERGLATVRAKGYPQARVYRD